MRCEDVTIILCSGYPCVTLEDLILAIVIQRRCRGNAQVIVSRSECWQDIEPRNWPAESYVAVPQLLLASILPAESTADHLLKKLIRKAGHSLLYVSEQDEEQIRHIADGLLYSTTQQVQAEENPPIVNPYIGALGMFFCKKEDGILFKLLSQSVFLYDSDRWEEELIVLHSELQNSARTDEQWTGLVNRFAIFDL